MPYLPEPTGSCPARYHVLVPDRYLPSRIRHTNAAGAPGKGRGARFGRWQSRVRGLDEIFGEFPAACLAEEIDTPGEGGIKALITISGYPVVSTPNSGRLDAALEQLEFMVALDVYLNETTRHADVVLPAPSPLRRSHYDLALYLFAVRNVANYSPPVLPLDPELPDEWVTLLRLTGIAAGLGSDADVAAIDEQVARAAVEREVKTAESRSRAARSTRCWPNSSHASARSGCST